MPKIIVSKTLDKAEWNKGVRMAKAFEVSKIIGFDAGAVPMVGINATVVVDSKVTQKPFLYSSGGSTCSLVKIQTDKFIESCAQTQNETPHPNDYFSKDAPEALHALSKSPDAT